MSGCFIQSVSQPDYNAAATEGEWIERERGSAGFFRLPFADHRQLRTSLLWRRVEAQD